MRSFYYQLRVFRMKVTFLALEKDAYQQEFSCERWF